MTTLTAIPIEDIYLIVEKRHIEEGMRVIDIIGECFIAMEINPTTGLVRSGTGITSVLDSCRVVLFQSTTKYPCIPLFKVPWMEDVDEMANEAWLRDPQDWVDIEEYRSIWKAGYSANPKQFTYDDLFEAFRAGGDGLNSFKNFELFMNHLKQPPSYSVTLGNVVDGIQLIKSFEKI